mmetsp:Transcript_16916/g.20099  ORF Transcript_16916/g.20099 Transcript_16916/m.20099 type:complete len:577 (-) Transcript_16916:293-2023(-)
MDDDGNESDNYSYTYSYEGSDDDTNSHSSDTPMDTKESATAVRHDRLSNSSRNGPIDYGMGDSDGPQINMTSTTELHTVLLIRVNEFAELFQIRPSVAHVLLRSTRWNKERLCELYTSDPDKTVKDAGVACRHALEPDPPPTDTNNQKCPSATVGVMTRNRLSAQKRCCAVCFDDDLQPSDMIQMPCNHEFCTDCWKCFIATMMKDGHTCIRKTCPQDRCNELVTEEEVAKISPELLPKYQSFQLRSFVELNGTSRWCPGPGCERVAALSTDATGASSLQFTDSTIIATCDVCTTSFCLKCGEEPHAPLICKFLSRWHEKCRNESETANWILANTKACSKCGSRIEKNQGCNHMTCQQCKHEFCWICMGDWVDHGATTGGYYRCNKYDQEEELGTAGPADQSDAAKAKRELDRYLHYYKRYHAHAEAQKFARKQLKETEERMMRLQETSDNVTWTDVEYLKTANEQLVECRRVLKYTYCFAYYMPERVASLTSSGMTTESVDGISRSTSLDSNIQAKMLKDQFENHQEMLERFTENLSELVEKPLKEIVREAVVNQTRVVNQFMKNILKYVEDEFD